MNIVCITSMNESYYDKCGNNMISSYLNEWINQFPLYVYNEDFSIGDDKIIEMGWNLGQEYINFQNRHTNKKVKIFSKKAFSIIHAMENIDCDRLIWLDADTYIKKLIPIEFINELSPDDCLSTHFSVWHEKDGILYHSCETGFFILNKRHPKFTDFYNTYKNIYINDQIQDLRRFYDGEVYGKTVQILESKNINMKNLNTTRAKTPMPRSIIDPYISHYKAGLKYRVNQDVQ